MDFISAIGDALRFISNLPSLVLIGVGVPMLLFGAEWLVRGAVAIAQRLGISTLVIGLTIVAAGTSAPELVVNVFAATAGNAGISFGNVIGSNIANIGLIIGVGALITPMVVHSRVVRTELPWLIMITAGMVALALPIGALAMPHGYGRVEGIIMCIGFIALLRFWYKSAKNEDDPAVAQDIVEKAGEQAATSTASAVGLFLVGLVILLIGGRLSEQGAVKMAAYFGMSHAVIGMTVLAISTSLPELLTTIVACRRGHTDLAVGNVVGSNLFNILLVLGVTATIAEVPVPGMQGWQDLGAMMVFSLLLWWFSVTHSRKVRRWEGLVLLSLYVSYLTFSVVRDVLT